MWRLLYAFSVLLGAGRPASAQPTAADRVKAAEAIYPPWQRGDGSDVANRGFEFTVPTADVLADFHGSLDNPQLVLFASGNYFFALGQLVTAFEEAYPRYRGHVFYRHCRPASCSSRWMPAAR
jgi:hypothetical protein